MMAKTVIKIFESKYRILFYGELINPIVNEQAVSNCNSLGV